MVFCWKKDKDFSVGVLCCTGTEKRSGQGRTVLAAGGIGARQVN